MESLSQYDVCIIGAGVAGGVMAAYLGTNGLRVAVVEKNMAEQERIVGELLQPGGVIKLQEMGLQHLLEGFGAQPVMGYGLFMNGDNFRISYPKENGRTITGRGFRNGKFVQRIREYILSLPTVTVYEGSALGLEEENDHVTGVQFMPKGEEQARSICASLTIVCDGMFSVFRDKLSQGTKQVSSYFLGMILKDCQLPFASHGHVIVAEPSPCLVYPISSSETRMLIDFPWNEAPRKSPELTAYFNNTIAPQLPPEILPSFNKAVEEGKFKVMPNHLIPAKPVFKSGAVLLGDSLNMRHPLTGGGMTAAFTDIKNLGEKLIHNMRNTEGIDQAVKSFYNSRHKENATINILADALYGVMKNKDLRIACYDYLKRGGAYAEEPVSILSAVSRDENLLLRHFFAVALFGIKDLLKPVPNLQGFRKSHKMLRSAVDIVSPLVMNERPGIFTRIALKAADAVL